MTHTFPAQGQTVDRAHVIGEPLADANGTYVALSRARESTRLYASLEQLGAPGDQDAGRETQLARLAGQLGRSEPELPSISTPLAHEQHTERELASESAVSPRRPDGPGDGEPELRRWPSEREQREQQRAQLDQARVERDQAAAELERARVERDQVARVIATLPSDPQVQPALTNARYAAGQAHQAAARAQQLDDQLDGLGRFARLREPGRALKAQLAAARERERQASERQHRLEQETTARQARLDRQRQPDPIPSLQTGGGGLGG